MSLIKVFALMTLILLPTMVIYHQSDSFVGKVPKDLEDLVRPTLGNIGHLQPVCKFHYIESTSHNDIRLECPTGKINLLTYKGIIPESSIKRNFCGENTVHEEIAQCSS
jgi:hypothetical protein